MPDLVSKSRFNFAPVGYNQRTRFDLSHDILTTFNTGELIPILAEPVNPHETFTLNYASLTRLETALHQTMDNAWLEFGFFFIPNRILWDNFEKFEGANDDPWTQTTQYEKPQIGLFSDVVGEDDPSYVAPGSLYNHLALPAGQYPWAEEDHLTAAQMAACHSIEALPLRAVFQVYNDWFRDENYDSIIAFNKGNSDIDLNETFVLNGGYFDPKISNLKVNRFKDFLSTALPAPQKGNGVTLGAITGATAPIGLIPTNSGTLANSIEPKLDSSTVLSSGTFAQFNGHAGTPGFVTGDNWVADLSGVGVVNINQLRLAIAMQSMAERDAVSGTRYIEKLWSVWNVHTPGLELDRSLYLGGKRIPIHMMEVLQTSETGTTVLGTDAGHSKTADSSEGFIQSFTQHGWIIGFAWVRTSRSYSQGIDRKFRNKSIYDDFDPMLDNIGEVAIEKSEVYAITDQPTTAAYQKGAWGYQEAWYHLKSRNNRYSGYFQPGISGTLDSWHYGDSYNSTPSMSAEWLKEGSSNVDRTIAVSSDYAFQWRINVHFELYATRPMAKHSVPNTFGF